MNAEKNLIFELLRFMDYDKPKIKELIESTEDFAYVLGQLAINRVGGVAYDVLCKSGLLYNLNREFRTVLHSIYEINKIKAGKFMSALKFLGGCFKDADFDYAFLKGSYLSACIYDEGLRTSNDFDILISGGKIEKCESILKQNGFVQGKYIAGKGVEKSSRREIVSSRMNRGETVPFILDCSGSPLDVIEVDINFSLDYKAKNERDIVSLMLQNTKEFTVAQGKMLKTLAPEDFLIHLCVHLFKEATVYDWVKMGRDLSLYKFLDIYAFINKHNDSGFFKKLSQKITQYDLCKECYYALFNSAQIFKSLLDIAEFHTLIEKIKPLNTDYLKEIIYPSENKVFSYESNFDEWVFTPCRMSALKERRV